MSDKSPDEKDGLLELIKKLWLPVSGFLGAITLVYNFYQLWRGDQATVKWLTAGGGLIVLVIVLGWVGLSKKTVVNKKKTRSEPRYSIIYRRIALTLLGIVVIGSGLGGWFLYKNSVSQAEALERKIIILVAQFDEPQEDYGLRDQMMEELYKLAGKNDRLMILDGTEIVTAGQGSEYARKLGKNENADLVIWAWYKAIDNPNITIHFENLSTAQIEVLKSSETYQPQATLADLESFEVQQKIGSETKTLISFISGMASYQSGDFQKALDSFEPILLEKNVSTYIDPVTLYFKTGTSYLRLNSYERSIENYDHLLTLDANYTDAYYNRGLAYSYLKDYSRAVQDFDKVIELDLNSADAYTSRGLDYYHLKNDNHAIQDFDKAIKLDPNQPKAYLNRGLTYSDLQDYNRAILDYSKAIELDPSFVMAYYGRGIAYFLLKNYDLSIQDFSEAIKLDPQGVVAYYNRGLAYSASEDYSHAVQDFDKAIELDPSNADAYDSRGIAYYYLKNYDQAIQNYDKAIELEPGNADTYNTRGTAYAVLNNYDRAIQDFNKAIELNPDFAKAYGNRGHAYQFIGRTVEAEADFAKYKELTGQDAP